MALGEAFVEVRADLRPFTRDLDKQLKVVLTAFEKNLESGMNRAALSASKSVGATLGQGAGQGFEESFGRRFGNKKASLWVRMVAAIGSALDDGLSALPPQAKAAVVAAILAVAPVVGAMFSGALSAGIGAAVVGLGIALASQFEQVQDSFEILKRSLRDRLVEAAASFGPALLDSFGLIDMFLTKMLPTIQRIFDNAAKFVTPLTSAVLNMFEQAIKGLDYFVARVDPFMHELNNGFVMLGAAINKAFQILANTGQEGVQALRLLFQTISALIILSAGLLAAFTRILEVFRKVLVVLETYLPWLNLLRRAFDDNKTGATSFADSNYSLEESFNGVIAKTKEEEQALKDAARAMDELIEATYANIQVDIDFERSLDNLTKKLKENGDTLDITKEKGRENVEAFLAGLKDAEEQALNRLQTQGYTAEQAATYYDQEIERLRQVANQAGITDAEFEQMFGHIVDITKLRIDPEEMGVGQLGKVAKQTKQETGGILENLKRIAGIGFTSVLGALNVPGYADGDIVDRPTLGVFGEAGPEVIIPLTKPARAAQLARESGLTAILGASPSQVLVFIGSEQLEAKMVKVVERNNKNQALALNQGPRGF